MFVCMETRMKRPWTEHRRTQKKFVRCVYNSNVYGIKNWFNQSLTSTVYFFYRFPILVMLNCLEMIPFKWNSRVCVCARVCMWMCSCILWIDINELRWRNIKRIGLTGNELNKFNNSQSRSKVTTINTNTNAHKHTHKKTGTVDELSNVQKA